MAAPAPGLVRRVYRRLLARLPPGSQVATKRALLAGRQRARALAGRGPGALAGRPIVRPGGDPRLGTTLVRAFGGGRPQLAAACAEAASRRDGGEPVVLVSDHDGVDLARDRGLVLELVPPEAEWRAATGGDATAYARFRTARLDDLADVWDVARTVDVPVSPG
ncbi:hypothetical protein ER308_14720 [Egibacter rhizosphaerae]|uniref:Uncharacterized protein n=1 Tax=Egibacter rhizosphaerae TaxID=1670831 RepID=A0A411YHE4_9ACTN|nr:hypothetical protein [Egibacter rhizosphaerae]QBI20688.1 hypothetical protein ER308_14720 [Egibacter rhizosphaerae]